MDAEIWYELRMHKHQRLWDTYRFAGFRPSSTIRGIFGDPKARIIRLQRRGKKHAAVFATASRTGGTTTGGVACATCLAEMPASTWSWKSGVWRAGLAPL